MARFSRGRSGNPSGRPVGSRNRASVWLDRIAEDQAADLLRIVMRRARSGDMRAAAIVLSRCWPQRNGGRVRFDLPPLHSTADLPRAIAAILQRIADGTLSPEEGAAVAAVLEQHRRAIELTEIEGRLRSIEERIGHEGPTRPA
jgi:hypothetical protein